MAAILGDVVLFYQSSDSGLRGGEFYLRKGCALGCIHRGWRWAWVSV